MEYQDALDIIKPNLDADGLVVNNKEQFGGGDTAQREGMEFHALAIAFPESKNEINLLFSKAITKISDEGGFFFRHSKVYGAPEWYADAKDFSRDQSISLIAALGELNQPIIMRKFWDHIKQNDMRAQNGDLFIAPDFLALAWRSLYQCGLIGSEIKKWIWLSDLWLIGSVLFAIAKANADPSHNDDLNLEIMLIQSKRVLPTWFGGVARRLFAKYRPPIKGTVSTWGPASAMEAYFSGLVLDIGAPRLDRLYIETGILQEALT